MATEYMTCEKHSGIWHTHCGKCKEADDLQRREYAKAALGRMSFCLDKQDMPRSAVYAFDMADAMLIEQHKREGGQ